MTVLTLTAFCSNLIAYSQVGEAVLCRGTSFRADKKDHLAPVSPGHLQGSMPTIDDRDCTFHFFYSTSSTAVIPAVTITAHFMTAGENQQA